MLQHAGKVQAMHGRGLLHTLSKGVGCLSTLASSSPSNRYTELLPEHSRSTSCVGNAVKLPSLLSDLGSVVMMSTRPGHGVIVEKTPSDAVRSVP